MPTLKRATTHFLRFAIFCLGALVLALCVFALPSIWKGGSEDFPMASKAIFMIVVNLGASAIPFFIALWQALKLLGAIDKGTAFSEASVLALRNIKRCAIAIAVLYVVNVPLLFPIADADDAPGLLVIGMAIAGAPIVVAVFAAVLERLLQDAIVMKSENELTV